MKRAASTSALVLLAGCQVVFPLAEPPVEIGTVHGTITTKTAVQLVGGGFDVITGTGDDATVIATVDGEDVAVPVVDGELAFERSAPDYRLAVSFGGEVLEFQDDAADLALQFSFAGRDGTQPVTQMAIELPPPVAGTVGVVASTGVWSMSVASSAMLDWTRATPTGNKPIGLLSSADGDRLAFLRYSPSGFAQSTASVITDYIVRDDVMMTNGGTVDLTGPLTHQTAGNRCARLHVLEEANAQRLIGVLDDVEGPGYDPARRDWQVFSVPSVETGGTGATTLAFDTPTELDFDVDGAFFDPFGGAALAFVEVASNRLVKFADNRTATPIPASIGFLDVVPAGADCTASVLTFDDNIALARDIALDGAALDTEFQAVALARPSNAVLTWTPDNTRFDVFDVVLFEVIDTGTGTALGIRRHFRTRTPRLVIPDDLLAPGHRYLLQIVSQVAFPRITEGDYATFMLPVITGTVYSSVFEAM